MGGRRITGVVAAVAVSFLVLTLVASSARPSSLIGVKYMDGPALKMLNPGLRSGEEKDPDDPWG